MYRKLTVGTAAAVFFGVVFGASAAQDFYPGAELTNGWFSAGISGMSDQTISSGDRWNVPEGCEAKIESHQLKFEAEADSPLKYTPAGGSRGPIVLVDVKLVVDPNAAIPSTDGLSEAQAALSVVTNTSNHCLEWIGLVEDGATNAWVALVGDAPVAGEQYDVQIALDNRVRNDDKKKIRYSVKGPGDAGYTVLTAGGNAWLNNPRPSSVNVSAVAFAGAGTVDDFGGVSILNDGVSVGTLNETAGFDFTNGTVTAVVTIPADGNVSGSARTAVLRVVDFVTGVATEYTNNVAASGSVSWDLSALNPGGTYAYTVTVKSGTEVREVKSGTFAAANWSASRWFGADVSNGVPNIVNGAWNDAAELNTTENRWDVSSDALFSVDDISKGSNAVTCVDTTYSFESFIDEDSLEAIEGDAVGGIVAVSDGGGTWYAFTGVNNPYWQALSGGVVPAVATEYVVRAEFDFMSDTHRVRYLVKEASDPDTSFAPLALNGNEWVALASSTPGSLSSVGMSGKGYVKSISAKLADKAVAESNGVKYNTLWEALLNGNGTVTLLTSATLKPSDISGGKFGPYTIVVNGHTFVFDKSQLTGKWQFVQKDGQWYLMRHGATYIFF